MKAKLFTSSSLMIPRTCLALSALLLYLAIQPARAAPQATIVGGILTENTIWTAAGNPYQVYISLDVPFRGHPDDRRRGGSGELSWRYQFYQL